MKTINFAVEDDIYEPFKAEVESNGMKIAGLFRMFMRSYSHGGFSITDGEVVASGNVPRETSPESRNKAGRPLGSVKKGIPYKSKTHDDKGKLLPWHEQDHSERNIWDFKMYPEPHLAVDPRPHLTLETEGAITGKRFVDTLYEHYLMEACECTEREWDSKLWEYVSCCALKFFTVNKMQNIRYDPDTLFKEVYALRDEMQFDVAKGKEYAEEQRNAAK